MSALTPILGQAQSKEERQLIDLARQAVVAEVQGEKPTPLIGRTPARPVFVTVEIAGKVRGCRGNLNTRARTLEEEVALAARSAATHDPRYLPLAPRDLKSFLVTVTVVTRTEPLTDVASLSPEDGLVLRSGGKTGIVLPWEGKDPEVRLGWAYRKAGVGRNAPVSLQRLVAQRFRG